jgi:hypothetical protein
MSQRMSWRTLLHGMPRSEPPDNDKVVQFKRETLDQMEHRLRDLQNRVVDSGLSVERAVMAYNSARTELEEYRVMFAERLKESGVNAEFPIQFPEAALDDKT